MQAAINKIANSGLKLTIIIIAHRVTTIETANNLLVFKGRSNLVTVTKGTDEYEEVMKKIRNVNSAPIVEDSDSEEIEVDEIMSSHGSQAEGYEKINNSRENTLTYLDDTAKAM